MGPKLLRGAQLDSSSQTARISKDFNHRGWEYGFQQQLAHGDRIVSCRAEYQRVYRPSCRAPSNDPGVLDTSEIRTTGTCVGLDRRGTGSNQRFRWQDVRSRTGATHLLTGYSNVFSPGADPAPCNLWSYHQFQALVRFDIEGLGSGAVTAATLSFSSESFPEVDGRVLAPGNCGYEVRQADRPWRFDFDLAIGRGNAVPSRPIRPTSATFTGAGRREFDVTRAVGEWHRGTRRNNGFVVGADERFLWEDVDRYCTHLVDDFRLSVTLASAP